MFITSPERSRSSVEYVFLRSDKFVLRGPCQTEGPNGYVPRLGTKIYGLSWVDRVQRYRVRDYKKSDWELLLIDSCGLEWETLLWIYGRGRIRISFTYFVSDVTLKTTVNIS